MRINTRSTLALAIALGLVASLALASVALAAETKLTATLAGDAETDADGTGTATIVLDPDAGTACWEMSAADIDPVGASHIHVGAAGASGDVAVNLDIDGFEGSSEGCTEDVDAATLQAIIDDPAGYYVNLHTEPFPGGAIRGQLAAANPNTALPSGDRTAVMLGALLLALAAAVALRSWRPLATRD